MDDRQIIITASWPEISSCLLGLNDPLGIIGQISLLVSQLDPGDSIYILCVDND